MTTLLREGFPALLLDLDGTLYLGARAIDGAADAIATTGLAVRYVTNNASRSPGQVAEHLTALGFSADEDQVVTAAQVAVDLLSDAAPAGVRVLVVGSDELAHAVTAAGYEAVRTADPQPAVVLQGHSPETAWPILAEASYAIRAGAAWIAANEDLTLPTERGFAPGNGAMVVALRACTDRAPVVAGKPGAAIVRRALRALGVDSGLVVGDRLDTDIGAASAAGVRSLLVCTGVSGVEDVFRAVPAYRPTYLAFGLSALNEPVVTGRDDWHARFTGADIELSGAGHPLRAIAVVAHEAWANPGFRQVVAAGNAAGLAIEQWRDRAITDTAAVGLWPAEPGTP